jgi:hypothetical protein
MLMFGKNSGRGGIVDRKWILTILLSIVFLKFLKGINYR